MHVLSGLRVGFAVLTACMYCACAARHIESQPDPPRWPAQFSVRFTFDVPYIKRYQAQGLRYQYQIWQDSQHGRQRMERGTKAAPALETVIEDVGKNKMYTKYVHKTELRCKTEPLDGGSGPTMLEQTEQLSPDAQPLGTQGSATTARRLQQWRNKAALTYVLPEVTTDRWKYGGRDEADKQTVHTWVLNTQPSEGYGHYKSNYTLTVTEGGAPVKLDIWGINPYTGGHFDHYIARFSDFKSGDIDEDVFAKPKSCKDSPAAAHPKSSDLRSEIAAILPPAYHGDSEYDQHVLRHGLRHRSQTDYAARQRVFHDNKRFVQEWNSQQAAGGHTLELNHWADVSAEEYRALLAGNKAQRARWAAAGLQTAVHQPTVAAHMLPPTLDWRGSQADPPVKNQAACGSCWAFGAVGALETAYYRVTGKQRLFSEQNLIDCSWDIPSGDLSNKGCYDGYQQIAFEYVWRTGGIAAEADYPYLGVSSYCNSSTPLTKFKKGKTVYVKGGEQGLKEALLTKGPMTVSVDAGSESFRFYKSGIYNNTQCHVKPVTDLDHAVLVSGYGTENGQDYWIVKNTWSANWGEDGYIRIARQPADCGIATEPLYVEIQLDD